jgi:nucleotide-binding universal stress UspA family protein
VVLKVVERHPGVVYIGAGVLVWTAVKMITGEPVLKPWLQQAPLLAPLAYAAIPLVLWAGFAKNHRRLESRIHARLVDFGRQLPQRASAPPIHATPADNEGDPRMLKVLVPVDGSANALHAVRHAIAEYRRHHELELHLLNVQTPLSRHVARFVGRDDRDIWHHDQAEAAMTAARALLDQAGVPYQTHWAVQLGAHHIVMGTARKNSITRMLEDSTTNQVLERTPVPVEVIAGEAVSKWERWGLPAGVLGGGGILLLAALD